MSSNLAKWYHSMTFTYASEWDDDNKKHGTINTWDDWHLVPTSRPVFQQGEPKTTYIDIPGADGHIDLTEVLTGYPTYQNREGSVEFIVMNGYRQVWAAGFSKFANWLHGKKIRVVLDDDPDYFYEGRFKLTNWNSNNDGTWSNVTLDYNLKPYKYALLMSTEDWLWDPFNFETGIVYRAGKLDINGYSSFVINTGGMHVIPEFIITPNNADKKWRIELNGTSMVIDFSKLVRKDGKYTIKDPRLELLDGINNLVVISDSYDTYGLNPDQHGKLDVLFRGGSL